MEKKIVKKRAGTIRSGAENWTVQLVNNKTGEIISTEHCNTVVNTGLERAARLFCGNSATYFRALAIGTGTNASVIGDTQLQTEYTRSIATIEYEASYKAKFSKTFTFGSGVAEDITEAGLFDSVTASGSVMAARVVFAAKSVSADIDLIVTCTITFGRG